MLKKYEKIISKKSYCITHGNLKDCIEIKNDVMVFLVLNVMKKNFNNKTESKRTINLNN